MPDRLRWKKGVLKAPVGGMTAADAPASQEGGVPAGSGTGATVEEGTSNGPSASMPDGAAAASSDVPIRQAAADVGAAAPTPAPTASPAAQAAVPAGPAPPAEQAPSTHAEPARAPATEARESAVETPAPGSIVDEGKPEALPEKRQKTAPVRKRLKKADGVEMVPAAAGEASIAEGGDESTDAAPVVARAEPTAGAEPAAGAEAPAAMEVASSGGKPADAAHESTSTSDPLAAAGGTPREAAGGDLPSAASAPAAAPSGAAADATCVAPSSGGSAPDEVAGSAVPGPDSVAGAATSAPAAAEANGTTAPPEASGAGQDGAAAEPPAAGGPAKGYEDCTTAASNPAEVAASAGGEPAAPAETDGRAAGPEAAAPPGDSVEGMAARDATGASSAASEAAAAQGSGRAGGEASGTSAADPAPQPTYKAPPAAAQPTAEEVSEEPPWKSRRRQGSAAAASAEKASVPVGAAGVAAEAAPDGTEGGAKGQEDAAADLGGMSAPPDGAPPSAPDVAAPGGAAGESMGDDAEPPETQSGPAAEGSKSDTFAAAMASSGPDRKLIVEGVPPEVKGSELAEFLSGAVLAAAGHNAHKNAQCPMPVVGCDMGPVDDPAAPGTATAVFRTAAGASVAVCLDGLEWRAAAKLRIRRPSDYQVPADGDPAQKMQMQGFDDLTLDDLLGEVADPEEPVTVDPSADTSKDGTAPRAEADGPVNDQDCAGSGAAAPTAAEAPSQGGAGGSADKAGTSAGTAPAGASGAEPGGASAPGGAAAGQPADGPPPGVWTPGGGDGGKPQEKPAAPVEKPPATHYEALGVPQNAVGSVIKKAYYSKSRIHHPDKNQNDPGATLRFQYVAEAYQVLSNPTKRAQYDANLVMQQACGNLGVSGDPRAAAFVQRHTGRPGLEVQGIQIEAKHVQYLVGKAGFQLQELKRRSGADILVLQNTLSVYAQVLIAGPSAAINLARQLIQQTIAELQGTQAPRDGVVLIVPPRAIPRMPQAAQQFQGIFMQTGAASRFAAADRIVVQGGMRVPQAVVQIQWSLEWSATILLPSGQQMTPWIYAHSCEALKVAGPSPTARAGEAYQYLLPPADPDPATVRHVLCYANGAAEEKERETPLVELALRVLHGHHNGRPVTGAVVRAATSVAVHAEHANLSPQAAAPLLCALHSIGPNAGIAPRFATMPLMRTLTALGQALNDPREGLFLRARGYSAVREAVPEDGLWHVWTGLLKKDSPIGTFWKEISKWVAERRHQLGVPAPPDEWLSVPCVMAMVLRMCVPLQQVEVDVGRGLRQHPTQAQPPPPPSAPPPAGVTRPAPPGGEPPPKSARTAAAAADEITVDETLTMVEQVEEVLLSLAGTDPAAYVHVSTLCAEVQKRSPSSTERPGKKLFESHKNSFELKKFHGADDLRVRLTGGAQTRAAGRVHERKAEALRKREETVAEQVLPKLSADSLPRTLRPPELAALLNVLSTGKHRYADDLPSALLRRLCRRGDAMPKELLQESAPFPPALVMHAIQKLDKMRRERWDKEAVDMVLQAAALDMHAVDDRPRATLKTAQQALYSAARRPFDERLNASRCLLVPSAALRLQVELAEGAVLSPNSSSFRPFAQMCAWLAHLVVTASLPQEVRTEVLQAFKKLATACEQLGRPPESAPCDPDGLCRLAMAVALVVREERKNGSAFQTEALEGLARVCVQRAMDESKPLADWSASLLAVLASAYAAADVPHESLFRKIGIVAQRFSSMGKQWKTEDLLKLLHAAFQLKQLRSLERFLKGLQADHGLDKLLKEATPRDLPLLFGVLAILKTNQLLEELCRNQKDKLKNEKLPSLVAILKEFPTDAGMPPAVGTFKSAVVREAVGKTLMKAPSATELQVLVDASLADSKSANRLGELAVSPALLTSLPSADTPWKDIRSSMTGVLGPFAAAGVEVPRLEAGCAARLLLALEKTSPDLRDFVPSVAVFNEGAFEQMPSLLQAIAEKLSKARLPRQGTSDATEVRRVCDRLLRAAKRLPPGVHGSGTSDKELDGWVDRLERSVLDEGRVGLEKRFDWLEQHASKRLKSVQDALGPTWLATLLVQSRRLSWRGGKQVYFEPPRPRAAVGALAQAARDLLGSSWQAEADGLDPDPEERAPEPPNQPPVRSSPPAPPGSRPRERDASRAPLVAPTPSAGSGSQFPPRDAYDGGRDPRARDAPIGASSSRAPAPGQKGPSPPQRPPPGSIVVSGGVDEGMAETLAGTYMPIGSNHSRPVYRRVDPPTESRVLLYYWDERDGEEQRGWWFGPEVGGEEVWAHSAGSPTIAVPPRTPWTVLHSGDVDPGLTVVKADTPRPQAAPGAGPSRAPAGSVARQMPGPTSAQASGAPGRPPLRPSGAAPGGAAGRPTAPQGWRPPAAQGGPSGPRPRGSAAAAALGARQPLNTPSGLRPVAGAHPTSRPSALAPSRPPSSAAGAPSSTWGAAPGRNAAQPLKRPKPDVNSARAEDLRVWLEGLDDGAGAMLQYFDVLVSEFDADLSMIAAAKVEGGEKKGILGVVDPSFWETVRVEKTGHKMLFARGIARL